mmetsp:Transcript_1/g.5  ORF Transcript_1/g.5 Transcript_1/m.5 type:complete len:219 (+) Transcript_1:198-854(+)
MPRITPDLVSASPQFTNPMREREIKLRANKIPAIENLGATQDQFDTIDLSDNEIRKLENFPLLKRIGTLLLSNNLIFRIADDLHESLPNLHTLQLTNNSILNLNDLLPLATVPTLKRLVLLQNNVTKQPNYRLFLVKHLPQVQVLDWKKVKPKEREEAEALYKSGGMEQKVVKKKLTAEEKEKIKEAIAGAKTLEEVNRLEAQLKSGDGLASEDAMAD